MLTAVCPPCQTRASGTDHNSLSASPVSSSTSTSAVISHVLVSVLLFSSFALVSRSLSLSLSLSRVSGLRLEKRSLGTCLSCPVSLRCCTDVVALLVPLHGSDDHVKRAARRIRQGFTDRAAFQWGQEDACMAWWRQHGVFHFPGLATPNPRPAGCAGVATVRSSRSPNPIRSRASCDHRICAVPLLE
jgi:hypothetical protein